MKSKLRVALVAPHAQFPIKDYGGTERVLQWLAKGLSEIGCIVETVVGSGSVGPFAQSVRSLSDSVDVVHFFQKTWSGEEPECAKPWVYTVHGNGQPGESFPRNSIFLSKNHAERHAAHVFVHNGVDPNDYRCAEGQRSYACFLGKARWKVKNVDGALKVAQRAGVSLHVLGGWRLSFFSGTKWHGLVRQDKKVDILSHAAALVNPVRWHEPFGLAMVEALMSGAFVVGTPYGSLPEIVRPEAGRLSFKASELVEVLKNFKPQPQKMRDYACAHFGHIQMARGYYAQYEKVLNGEVLHRECPYTLSSEDPEALLPWEEA